MRVRELMVLGASGEIGTAIAKQFDGHVDRMILVGRDEKKLISLQSSFGDPSNIKVEICDIRDFQSSKTLFETYKADLIINCIGVGRLERIAWLDVDKIGEVHDVNFESPARLMTYWMQNFKGRSSVFVNLASLASLIPHPYLTVYSSSKAAIYHFSLALNMELREECSTMSVYTYVLGPTKTSFFPVETQNKIGFVVFQMTPERLAIKLFRCISEKQDYAIIGKRYKILAWIMKCLPLRLVLKLMSHTLKKGV